MIVKFYLDTYEGQTPDMMYPQPIWGQTLPEIPKDHKRFYFQVRIPEPIGTDLGHFVARHNMEVLEKEEETIEEHRDHL